MENLCLAMQLGGILCGTFDGFGWDKFVKFLVAFSEKTGMKELGVYDSQLDGFLIR